MLSVRSHGFTGGQPKTHVIPAKAGTHAEHAFSRLHAIPLTYARHPGARRDPC
jgi:hypothetical protein